MNRLHDGIYDITGIDFLCIPSNIIGWNDSKKENELKSSTNEIEEFLTKHPKAVLAHAYETHAPILLARAPAQVSSKIIGWGFNYGANTIIQNCPQTILICAEND